jgi:hypothetical protein
MKFDKFSKQPIMGRPRKYGDPKKKFNFYLTEYAMAFFNTVGRSDFIEEYSRVIKKTPKLDHITVPHVAYLYLLQNPKSILANKSGLLYRINPITGTLDWKKDTKVYPWTSTSLRFPSSPPFTFYKGDNV